MIGGTNQQWNLLTGINRSKAWVVEGKDTERCEANVDDELSGGGLWGRLGEHVR